MVGAPRIFLRDIDNVLWLVYTNLLTVNFGTEMIISISKLKIVIFPYKIFLMNPIQTSWLQSLNILPKIVKFFDILSIHNFFTSNFKGVISIPKLSKLWLVSRSSNVAFRAECSLCVGEIKGSLQKRVSVHRFQIHNDGIQLLYKHFNSPDHSILSMRVF
jgi:hypothetical protein